MRFLGWVAATGAVLSASAASAQSAAHSELYDYLVQDVCVDASDRIIAGDPATCSRHRNLRLGEKSPFVLTDWDTKALKPYVAWSSFPVRGMDGRTRVLTYKDALPDGFTNNYSFSSGNRSDGFDLMDINYGSYASFIRTFDGGCLDQLISAREGAAYTLRSPASRAGGWVTFPLSSAPSSWPLVSAITNRTALRPISGGAGCSGGSSVGRTYWNRPRSLRFERNGASQGKSMMAIESAHFAGTDFSSQNNAMERFYFTREYGLTRWENWVPRSRCLAQAASATGLKPNCYPENTPVPAGTLDLRARCKDLDVSATAHPDIDRWGGQDWVRTDCRDLTRYVQTTRANFMLDSTVARQNGVVDIDYLGTVNAGSSTPTPAYPPIDPTLPPGYEIP